MTLASNKAATLSRRQLLFGRSATVEIDNSVRPPWSAKQIANCTGCGACFSACPEGILAVDADSIPTVEFDKGECTFCGACAEVCQEPVFDRTSLPWNLELKVDDQCFLGKRVFCRSCGDSCPARAISFMPKPGMHTDFDIDYTRCTGCGACVSVCPANSITIVPGVKTREKLVNG